MNDRHSRVGLGTVQWGVDYGVANRDGRTPAAEVERILAAARAAGLRVLDTAALYGEAESVLGEQDLSGLRVVTKTPRYAHAPITAADADDLRGTLNRSLARLRLPAVHGLLAHHADDLLVPGGERLIDALHALRAEGKAARIGVSVYDGAQLDAILARFTPDLVQLPLNVFDQRLIVDGSLARLAALGVEVHVRSVFLQGLLLMSPDSAPAYFDPWREQLRAWHAICAERKVQPQQAALAFACDLPEVSCCLIGVQNIAQFEHALTGLDTVPPFDAAPFACSDPALLNPASWRLS
ncbi:MAG: aldo/keto reductase [Methyloversatilis discipulorum]|uniref:aldo/keto reductase n=1 Tax=Methyloversatilis discipulorum TaxID=1119528 RepID=UPI0026EAA821|nr:aldo/keto reductase [Methyloversatilis discipulorum]MBV5287143.1 aldo/keto reductase [Methyloversatilis discipulorum]